MDFVNCPFWASFHIALSMDHFSCVRQTLAAGKLRSKPVWRNIQLSALHGKLILTSDFVLQQQPKLPDFIFEKGRDLGGNCGFKKKLLNRSLSLAFCSLQFQPCLLATLPSSPSCDRPMQTFPKNWNTLKLIVVFGAKFQWICWKCWRWPWFWVMWRETQNATKLRKSRLLVRPSKLMYSLNDQILSGQVTSYQWSRCF